MMMASRCSADCCLRSLNVSARQNEKTEGRGGNPAARFRQQQGNQGHQARPPRSTTPFCPVTSMKLRDPKSNRSAYCCEFMAIEPQYETTEHDETCAGIRGKRVGINESRSDQATRIWIFKPKNTPRHQRKGEKTVGSVGANDCGNGPEQEIRARGVSAQLQGNPEDACRRDKSQEGQARQFAIDADASINRSAQRIRGHLPYRMMQPLRRPCRILDQDPQHDGGKQRSRHFDLPDRHRVAFAS